MITVILAACILIYSGAVSSAKANGKEPWKPLLTATTAIGVLCSIAVFWHYGFQFLQGDIGKPNSPSFYTGRIIPARMNGESSAYKFLLRYEERKWWGKVKVGSWPVRWNEGFEEYEYLNKGWHSLPIFENYTDDRTFSPDNRGWHEDQ